MWRTASFLARLYFFRAKTPPTWSRVEGGMDGLCSIDLSFTSPLSAGRLFPRRQHLIAVYPFGAPMQRACSYALRITDWVHAAARVLLEWDGAEAARGARTVETVWTSCGCGVHIQGTADAFTELRIALTMPHC